MRLLSALLPEAVTSTPKATSIPLIISVAWGMKILPGSQLQMIMP
jgi:hypothetical protein